MKIKWLILRSFLLSISTLMIIPHVVFADTFEQLVDNDKLKVEVFLALKDKKGRNKTLARPVARNEQLDLIVKVTSERWFTRGTRVMPVSLNHALVLQRDKLASNYTQKIAGQSWVVQEWQLAIYPMQAGRYTIPSLTVAASVSLESGRTVEGYLKTESISFDVVDPVGQYQSNTLAATDVNASQYWNDVTDLKVGDVIERTLSIEVKNSTISLLPQFSVAQQQGMKAYREVIQSLDLQSRGRYAATKKVKHTYILQQSGHTHIPAVTIDWWDTKKQKMRSIVLPALDIEITHTIKSGLKQYWLVLIVLMVIIIAIGLLLRKLQQRYHSEQLPHLFYFTQHAVKRNWPQINRFLYNRNHSKNHTLKVRGKVAKELVDEWSKEQFSSNNQPDKRKLTTLIKLWFKL